MENNEEKSNHEPERRLVSRRKKKPRYMRTKKAAVLYARVNGDEITSNLTRVIGFSFNEILTNATQQLHLTSAAQKIYDETGTQLFKMEELRPRMIIIVSRGEPFINVNLLLRERVERQVSSFWGLHGLYCTKPKRKFRSNTLNSAKYGNKCWRVLVFSGTDYLMQDAVEVITDGKDLLEFQVSCSSKCGYNGICKKLFSYSVDEVVDVKSVIESESWVWQGKSTGVVYGPIWATDNLQLDKEIVERYVRKIIEQIQNKINPDTEYLKQLEFMEQGKLDEVKSTEIKAYSKKEVTFRIEMVRERLGKLNKDLETFKSRLEETSQLENKSPPKSPKGMKRAFSTIPGLRLKAFINGKSNEKDTFIVYFNVQKAMRGVTNEDVQFQMFLDYLSQLGNVCKYNDYSKGILVRRVFDVEANEITKLSELTYDQLICLSFGEDFVFHKDPVLTARPYFVTEKMKECDREFEINFESLKNFEVSNESFEDSDLKDISILRHKKEKLIRIVFSVSVSNNKLTLQDASSQFEHNVFQTWLFTKAGRILCRSIPQFCLTLIDKKVSSKDEDDKENTDDFFRVQLCSTHLDLNQQIWRFNADGLLVNEAYPDYHLSYCDDQENSTDMFDQLLNSNLRAIHKTSKSTALPNNRWALKQSCFSDMSQWRQCYLPNSNWHKLALTWPLNKDSTGVNEELKWPIKCFILPGAPSHQSAKVEESRFPRKLLVFRNGDHRMTTPILVVGPDLAKVTKPGSKIEDTVCVQEFEMFLDSCSLLGFPSSTKRLFSETGQELFSLNDLCNNSIVYASQGDSWRNPVRVKKNMHIRVKTNRMVVDVERLSHFVKMLGLGTEENGNINYTDYVIGVDNGELKSGSILQIQRINHVLEHELYKITHPDFVEEVPPIESQSSSESCHAKLTCHERTCAAACLRKQKMKDVDTKSNEDEIELTTKCAEPAPLSQQFTRINEFLVNKLNPQLMMYAEDLGKPIVLKKKLPSDHDTKFQWLFHSSGRIESAYFRGYLLSAACRKMLPFEDNSQYEYNNTQLVLEKSIHSKYGKAQQRFSIYPTLDLVFGMAVLNSADQRITAAIMSSICTSFVISDPVSQPAFIINKDSRQNLICQSCVSILNGRYHVTKVEDKPIPFTCEFRGGFKVLKPNKTDLVSTENANLYLKQCMEQLTNLKSNLLIKPIKNAVPATKQLIHTLLRLNNGQGRSDNAVYLVGETVEEIMVAAKHKFQLHKKVTVLFTEDGVPIYDNITLRNYLANKLLMKYPNLSIQDAERIHCGSRQSKESIELDKYDNKVNINSERELTVNLSEDQCYFIIEENSENTSEFYEFTIRISNISEAEQFLSGCNKDTFLIVNYSIFDNEINTSMFKRDDDIDEEEATFTIRSSPKSLARFFREVLPSLRFQIVKVTVDSDSDDEDDEPNINIQSIDAVAEIGLQVLSTEIFSDSAYKIIEPINVSLDGIFLDSKDFAESSASISLEFAIVKCKFEQEDQSKEESDKHSVVSSSIINEPVLSIDKSEPIELWASQGESFCHFNLSGRLTKKQSLLVEELKAIQSELENKKYLLRTVKGERLKNCDPGTLQASPSESNPVRIKGNWQFPSKKERELVKDIQELEATLKAKKFNNSTKTSVGVDLNRDLYKQKQYKHYLLRKNGDEINEPREIFVESLYELKETAMSLFKWKQLPKYVFNYNGKKISELSELSPGELVTISKESAIFLDSESSKVQCEVKANWGRARRKHGIKSTELGVSTRVNTIIDTDPFTPHDLLMGPIGETEVPAAQAKNVTIFENGQPEKTKLISGKTLTELLEKSRSALKLSLPVKCFYTTGGRRIYYFKEILDEDLLAASVSGKGLLTSDD